MALGALIHLLALFLSTSPTYGQRALRGAGSIEDLFAYPRFRISFLDGFPVTNATAERWLNDGLKGGEPEFMGKVADADDGINPPGQIDGAVEAEVRVVSAPPAAPRIQRMVLGDKQTSYVCLLPDLSQSSSSKTSTSVPTQSPNPITSWQLLEPLKGKCFYLRQGWFTYSYCHNDQVRQFRELAHTHPHPPGGRTPEEDSSFEAYTLGVSPARKSHGDVAVRSANNLELRGTGQRYLVQHWGDGTICDKSGRPREVEIQFHCSMTATDGILLVKETRTCQYVLVLQTPRLCSEPGFRSERDTEPVNAVRCREISDSLPPNPSALVENTLPSAIGKTLPLDVADSAVRFGKSNRQLAGKLAKDAKPVEKKVGKGGNMLVEAIKNINRYIFDQDGGILKDVDVQIDENGDGYMIIEIPSEDEEEEAGEGEEDKPPKTFRQRIHDAMKAAMSARGQRQGAVDEEYYEEEEYDLQPHILHEDL